MIFEYAIVLTGSIATGKSSVSKIFSLFGFVVIDADEIAHEILDMQHQKVAESFGSEFVENGKVDRKILGDMIFADPVKRKILESLLHPLIYDEIVLQATKQDKLQIPYIIDIPLFFESGRYPIERSMVVYATKEQQLKRLMLRDGYTIKEAQQRIGTQIDVNVKRKNATYVINNTYGLTQLQKECEKIKKEILGDFK